MTRAGVGRRWLPLAGTAGVLLAWGNLVVPRLPPGTGVRTVANIAAVLALVVVARAYGLRWAELGVTRSTWRAGVRWGAAAFAVLAAGYLVVLAVPALRRALEDPRVEGMTAGALLLRALLLIPLGTVLCEEVAFRGVLLALASRVLTSRRALGVTAVVFGLWHVSSAQRPSGPGVTPLLQVASVAGTVAFTGLGGLVLGWLRQRTGSLLAPMGLHLGTNSVGLLAAAAAAGLG
ncbi:MAG: CPBP family intramembrane metalloprotease [Actinomycetota bacterium]|nr:CPBP family intramembrane metalloprotease [Actinomycetota bacterium]